MKKTLLILLIAVLSCIFIAHTNNDPGIIISGLIRKNSLVKAGELRYKVYLLGVLPIGEAVFAVERIEEYMGRKVYHLSAKAGSLKVFSKFFSASIALDSYVDRERSSPVLFRQRLIISDRKDSDREITYDQDNQVMSMGGLRRQILPDTQDPLSAIFNLRRMDFDKIKEFAININSNQKNYILKGQATRRDVAVDRRVYRVILVIADISRHDKNPYHKSNVSMVLLQQKDNIPVVIKVFSSGVLINAKLVDIK